MKPPQGMGCGWGEPVGLSLGFPASCQRLRRPSLPLRQVAGWWVQGSFPISVPPLAFCLLGASAWLCPQAPVLGVGAWCLGGTVSGSSALLLTFDGHGLGAGVPLVLLLCPSSAVAWAEHIAPQGTSRLGALPRSAGSCLASGEGPRHLGRGPSAQPPASMCTPSAKARGEVTVQTCLATGLP